MEIFIGILVFIMFILGIVGLLASLIPSDAGETISGASVILLFFLFFVLMLALGI